MLALLNPVDGALLEVAQIKNKLPLHVQDERGKVAEVSGVFHGVNVLVDAVFERAEDRPHLPVVLLCLLLECRLQTPALVFVNPVHVDDIVGVTIET